MLLLLLAVLTGSFAHADEPPSFRALQSADLDFFLAGIGGDLSKDAKLSAATTDEIHRRYNDRKARQADDIAELAGQSRAALARSLRDQLAETDALITALAAKAGVDAEKMHEWRLAQPAIRESLQKNDDEAVTAAWPAAYQLLLDVHAEARRLDPLSRLRMLEERRPAAFSYPMDVMDAAEDRIYRYFLQEWRPPDAPPYSMEARTRLARQVTSLYFLHQYPVSDASGAKLNTQLDRIDHVAGRDQFVQVARLLSQGAEALEKLTQSPPICLDEATLDRRGDPLSPVQLAAPPAAPGGRPAYCKAVDRLGYGRSCPTGLAAKRLVLDPGHLGGAYTKDDRDFHDYREGRSNFITTHLTAALLTDCLGYPSGAISITRSDLDSVGRLPLGTDHQPLATGPASGLFSYDDLEFRAAYIDSLRPDLFVSIHTDATADNDQHGTVFMPRPSNDPQSYFYKESGKAQGSAAAGERVRQGLNEALYDTVRDGLGGRSCADLIGYDRAAIGKGYGDYAVFREVPHGTPTLIIEGLSHQQEQPRGLLTRAMKDTTAANPDTELVAIHGKPYTYHPILRCYAEGIAIGLAKALGCGN